MGKVKLRFIRGYACGHTQVKNVPHRILTATVYHRIYINAVVASPLDTVCKLWPRLSGEIRLQFGEDITFSRDRCRFWALCARSDVFDGPACRGFPEVKRTFGFCFRCSVVEVKKISPAAPHHRKVSAPPPPLRLKTQPKSHSPTAFAATSSSFHHSKRPPFKHILPSICRVPYLKTSTALFL